MSFAFLRNLTFCDLFSIRRRFWLDFWRDFGRCVVAFCLLLFVTLVLQFARMLVEKFNWCNSSCWFGAGLLLDVWSMFSRYSVRRYCIFVWYTECHFVLCKSVYTQLCHSGKQIAKCISTNRLGELARSTHVDEMVWVWETFKTCIHVVGFPVNSRSASPRPLC